LKTLLKYFALCLTFLLYTKHLDIDVCFFVHRLVISLVYYAVSFSSGTYGGNRYLVFFLTSLVEIPSNWTCIILCRRWVTILKSENLKTFTNGWLYKQDFSLGANWDAASAYIVYDNQKRIKNTTSFPANLVFEMGMPRERGCWNKHNLWLELFSQITCKSRCCTYLFWTKVCFRIGRKKTTVLGVVVSFIASVIAVLFQRDLKNTGTLLFKSVIDIRYRGKRDNGIPLLLRFFFAPRLNLNISSSVLVAILASAPCISLLFMRNYWLQCNW